MNPNSSLPLPTQEVVKTIKLTVLAKNQYCVVVNPVDTNGKSRLGYKELRKGPSQFFLQPGQWTHIHVLYGHMYMYCIVWVEISICKRTLCLYMYVCTLNVYVHV